MVYPICEKCGVRRDRCVDISAHKRHVGWVADIRFGEDRPRLRKVFHSTIDNPKEAADAHVRQVKTDYERGLLSLEAKPRMSFETVADEWWTHFSARICTPMNSEYYRYMQAKKIFGNRDISAITLADGEAWVTAHIKKGLAVNTINRMLRSLKWIINHAVKKGYISVSPFLFLPSLKGGNIRVRWMTEAEVTTLVKAAYELGDDRLVEIIAVGVNTGFRKGNLARLAARDVQGGVVLARLTKSGDPYDVPIAPAIAGLLRRLAMQHPTGPLLDTHQLDKRFRKAAQRAGLYTNVDRNLIVPEEEKVTIHTLRHTFAALFLKRDGTLHRLKELLGHSSIGITDKTYAHICVKDLIAQAPLISTPIVGLEAPNLKLA